MSVEDDILKIVAKRHVVSIEELKKEMNKKEINKVGSDIVRKAIDNLKTEGLISSSDLLSPATLVITTRGLNASKDY